MQTAILIGGSSNIGKSTLAAHLAERLGWEQVSTDSLARHPGRPWRPKSAPVPPPVADHYLGLGHEELLASVLNHYRDMWPGIERLVHKRVQESSPLVLEGSALLPENVASLRLSTVSAIWLTGGDSLYEARIKRESRYEDADPRGREMISKFLERSLRFNRMLVEHVRRLDLPYIEIEKNVRLTRLADLCLSRMRPLRLAPKRGSGEGMCPTPPTARPWKT